MESAAEKGNLTIAMPQYNLSYEDVGEGKIPVIFLHGFPFDKTMWQPQLYSLKTSFRVIAPDIRGFGESIDETSPLSIDLFADDLIGFMDKLNIDKAIVCGLSMGGYITLNAYERYPDRFEALILADTQCVADTAEGKEKRYKAIEEIELNGVENFYEKFIKSVFHKDSLTNKKEVVEELSKVVYANPQHVITRGLTALAERSETCSSLNKVTIPTLIICGREDELTPPAQSEFMHNAINGSILKFIDQAGHVSNLEQPDEFNQHLLTFLTALSSPNMNEELIIG